MIINDVKPELHALPRAIANASGRCFGWNGRPRTIRQRGVFSSAVESPVVRNRSPNPGRNAIFMSID